MSKPTRVAFNRPYFSGRELHYIAEAIQTAHTSGDGAFSKKCQAILENLLGVPKALLTTSCTDALELSALLLDMRPPDEFIVPSFTFVSTANAFALRGARPVFCDIRPDTLNLDETKLEALITPKTKAILPVHYAGVGCEMDAILEIGKRRGIPVIEDNAHGLFGKYKGKSLGSFGTLATQSFHETKNIICGEGGAILINDPSMIERAEILREKGTDRSKFFRGQVDKYGWVDIGSSFLPSELLAAYLFAQLEAREFIQKKRKAIWDRYAEELKPWAEKHGVQLPTVPAHCEQAYHMFYMLLPSLGARQTFIAELEAKNINCVFHYIPLHNSKMGMKYDGKLARCPVTESVSDRLVRLPFFCDISERDQTRVIEEISASQVPMRRAA